MESLSDSAQARIELLSRQLQELQDRVATLEQRLGLAPAASVTPDGMALRAAEPSGAAGLEETASVVPILGRALLAIAGAYLLRAITELGTLSPGAGVTLGIAYALFWLVLAARTPAEQRLQVTIHGLTSVLVLSPLLWESTVRFQALATWVTAAVLVLFSAFGLAISFKKDITIIAWITTLGGVFTASVLLVATHDVIPFTAALLAIAVVVEVCACMDHWLRERWVVAGLADLAVLLVAYLVSRKAGLPQGYAPISTVAALGTQIALLIVYLASTVVRTLGKGYSFTVFEITQAAVAFLISVSGALRIAHGNPAASWAVAIFILLAGAACYVVSFAFLERKGGRNRNFYTYSTFAVLLTLVGTRLIVSESGVGIVWPVLALVCIRIGVRAGRTTLLAHGAVYLLLAALVSGLFAHAVSCLLGTGVGWGRLEAGAFVSALAACAGYALLLAVRHADDEDWAGRVVVLIVFTIGLWSVAGLFSGLLVAARAGGPGSAMLRTAVLTVTAVALAWCGRKWRRFELVWLVFPLMLLAAYRLLTRDLREEHTLALFLALLLYGGALVLLPRILQQPKQ